MEPLKTQILKDVGESPISRCVIGVGPLISVSMISKHGKNFVLAEN